ncbi:MAG: DUF3108 domain-containing protein [Elusimicrobia bacterium]|nr:DUF3108 domain-containing protein [Elusimicrobiota bacterium]
MRRNGLLNKVKLFFLLSWIIVNQGSLQQFAFAETKKLPNAEKLVFDVYWKFIKVGYGTLEIKGIEDYNGRKAYHIYSEAKSAPFFDTFCKVRDTNESRIDVENFYSLVFEQNINEGKHKFNRRTEYDQQKHLAVNNKGESFSIPENVLDVLGAFYWVRLQELKQSEILTANVNSRKKNYKMVIKICDKKTVKVNGKKYKTIVVKPNLQDAGIFRQKGEIKIWLTDDEKHIPVKMKSEISVGSIVAELREMPVDTH